MNLRAQILRPLWTVYRAGGRLVCLGHSLSPFAAYTPGGRHGKNRENPLGTTSHDRALFAWSGFSSVTPLCGKSHQRSRDFTVTAESKEGISATLPRGAVQCRHHNLGGS